ncbi:TPA: hypothetical protein J0587_004675 [Salmonella enterica subsp. enterica serovar Kentucky]|nr:hypothetical protein [Salmonella enterica subsp. enterica serovar Kentucky]
MKHKSGRVLFVTSDKFIAENRRKMGWIVEKVKMTSREQFEKWVSEKLFPGIHFAFLDNGEYVNTIIQQRWEAWQESRAAIDIEQPEFIDSRSVLDKGYMVDYSNGFGDAMDAFVQAIEQAGLKVKK